MDRNTVFPDPARCTAASLPSRGAWIEMQPAILQGRTAAVAPLVGSVDRNNKYTGVVLEIDKVAPLVGSVDRNWAA